MAPGAAIPPPMDMWLALFPGGVFLLLCCCFEGKIHAEFVSLISTLICFFHLGCEQWAIKRGVGWDSRLLIQENLWFVGKKVEHLWWEMWFSDTGDEQDSDFKSFLAFCDSVCCWFPLKLPEEVMEGIYCASHIVFHCVLFINGDKNK